MTIKAIAFDLYHTIKLFIRPSRMKARASCFSVSSSCSLSVHTALFVLSTPSNNHTPKLNELKLLHPFWFLQPSFSPGRYFLWKLVTVVLMQKAWQDSFTWPMVIFLFTCCIYPLASSCAHTFSTMSVRARHICFFFDYGSISFYSLGKWKTKAVRGRYTMGEFVLLLERGRDVHCTVLGPLHVQWNQCGFPFLKFRRSLNLW